MRLTTLFVFYAGIFVILITGLTAVTLSNLKQSQRWDERTELAYASLEEHLLLQSKVFQLLKQHGDALIIGDLDGGALEAELNEKIKGSISRIRTIIASEIELVGEEEYEELELLAQIESKIAEVDRVLARLSPEDADAADGDVLVDLLDQTIDVELATLIQAAVEEEREEVRETRAAAIAFRNEMTIVTWATIAAAVVALIGALWSYARLLHLPFRNLIGAVKTYGTGDFAKDVPKLGGQELREMSGVLSSMAALLRQRELDQRQQNELLERKVAERTHELENLLQQIEMSEANRRRMMADISHELRTPLTIIRGEADVALRGTLQDPDVVSDTLARIRDSARHTSQIVDDMLLVARHEAGELRLDPKDIDIRQVITDAQDMFEAPIKVVVEAKNTRARVDRLRMRQCLLSVLHNALRYGGPNIVIAVRDNSEALEIAVSDNGPGMSDEDKAQAFERFYRGTNASRTPTEGTGLGLPIVRAIMEAHGGTASLVDADGGGLCVVLSLSRKKSLSLVDLKQTG